MRAFVTGMTGFVGRHLTRSLLADGVEVHGTLLFHGREQAPRGTTGHPVDITDAVAMAGVLAEVKPEVIFHLAGAASVGESFADPEGTWRTNVDGTRGLLEGMRRACPLARVVVALSGEQYGRVPTENLPVTEDTPFHPLSPYAKSKVAADNLCARYVDDHGLAVVRLRAFNQIGPGQDARFVLPSVCKQVADAEAEGVAVCRLHLGNTRTRRDFMDVRDTVAAYRILARVGDPCRAYLAGRGRSVPIQDLVDMVVSLSTVRVDVSADPSLVRDGEQPDLYCCPLALQELGWAPRIPLGQSVADTLDYWRHRAHVEVG